jgi:predicted GTPase
MEDEKECLNFDDARSDCCCCEGYDTNCHDYISESTKPKINIGVIGHVEHGKSTLVEALLKYNKNSN